MGGAIASAVRARRARHGRPGDRKRRAIAIGAGLGAVVLLAACTPMPPPDGTEAATFAVGAGHTGVSTTSLSETPVVRWRHRYPTESAWRPSVHSAVSSGDVVVAAAVLQDERGNRIDVTAFDRADGAVRWTRSFDGPMEYSPKLAVAGSRLFVVSAGAALRGLDLASGEVLWETPLPGAAHTQSDPTPAGSDVYVASSTGFGGQLHAVDQASGEVRWTQSPSYIDAAGLFAPTVLGDRVITTGTCRLAAFARVDGDLEWTSDAGCPDRRPTRVIVGLGDRLFVSGRSPDDDDGGVVLDASTGRKTGSFWSDLDPVVTEDTIYVHTVEAGSEYAFEAIDRATGEPRWRHVLHPDEATSYGNHVVVDGRLWFISHAGLVGLDTTTGEVSANVDFGPGGHLVNAGNGVILVMAADELVVIS